MLIPERDSATPATHVTRCAWTDLLFTMSDNTRASTPVFRRAICRECADQDFSRTSFDVGGGTDAAVWWSQTGSNRRPPACKAGALPTELWPRTDWLASRSSRQLAQPAFAKASAGSLLSLRERRLVGLGRFELPTSRLSSARSNQLSYKPGSDDRGRMTDDRIFRSVVCRPKSVL
jgi:hypothetical protein